MANWHFTSKKVTGSSIRVDATGVYRCEGSLLVCLFVKVPGAPFYMKVLL